MQRQEGLDHKLRQLEPEQLDQVYLRLFNSPDGELVLRDLSNRCFIESGTVNSVHSEVTALSEGRREVVLMILSRMRNTVTEKREEEND